MNHHSPSLGTVGRAELLSIPLINGGVRFAVRTHLKLSLRVWPLVKTIVALTVAGLSGGALFAKDAVTANAKRTIKADVVALDQPWLWNRLGAAQPGGMIFALRRDVVSNDGSTNLTFGQVMLKGDKRPRPLVL